MDFFETILPGVVGSVITAAIFALWQVSKAHWKKRRKLESDVVVVSQSVSLDDHGRYNLDLVLRNDAESTAFIDSARLLCTLKRKLELPIQAVSKVVPSALYDCEINPDDGRECYEFEIRQQIKPKQLESFTIRIDSSTNNWICTFNIVLSVNENAKELHTSSVGIYFEDAFDGWGMDHSVAHDVQTRLMSIATKSHSVTTLLDRIKDPSNQPVPGWVIYIPDATLAAFTTQGGDREQLVSAFLLRHTEPSIFLRVDGLDEPVEIAKCSFIEPNLVETVGHVVHNRRTGKQIEPSRLFVKPGTGDNANNLIEAQTYWLMPKPENNQPVEGVAFIRLTDSAENVKIVGRAYEIPDYETYGQQFS